MLGRDRVNGRLKLRMKKPTHWRLIDDGCRDDTSLINRLHDLVAKEESRGKLERDAARKLLVPLANLFKSLEIDLRRGRSETVSRYRGEILTPYNVTLRERGSEGQTGEREAFVAGRFIWPGMYWGGEPETSEGRGRPWQQDEDLLRQFIPTDARPREGDTQFIRLDDLTALAYSSISLVQYICWRPPTGRAKRGRGGRAQEFEGQEDLSAKRPKSGSFVDPYPDVRPYLHTLGECVSSGKPVDAQLDAYNAFADGFCAAVRARGRDA